MATENCFLFNIRLDRVQIYFQAALESGVRICVDSLCRDSLGNSYTCEGFLALFCNERNDGKKMEKFVTAYDRLTGFDMPKNITKKPAEVPKDLIDKVLDLYTLFVSSRLPEAKQGVYTYLKQIKEINPEMATKIENTLVALKEN